MTFDRCCTRQDHVEIAALVASSISTDKPAQPRELHYDLRVRGGTLEKDLVESRKRIMGTLSVFQSINQDDETLASCPVAPYFNLTADLDELGLPSTVSRELGFVAHHAIHHMHLVKIICTMSLGIQESEMPDGFGKAPSTIIFDKQQKQVK